MATKAERDVAIARKLRRQSTDVEQRLWRLLRARGASVKFRRQYALGPYFLDFYSTELRLAIEVDGGQHFSNEVESQDQERTMYLGGRDVRVLRFTNREVLLETEAVLERIWEEVERRMVKARPSP